MTDQERKAIEMALDALEGVLSDDKPYIKKSVEAIEALRQALNVDAIDISATCVDETEKREHEPVAWIGHSGNLAYSKNSFMPSVRHLSKPLYTAPPSKQEPVAWVKEGKVRVGFGRIEERKYVQFDQTLPIGTKLFAAPVSKQEWVSLTDEEVKMFDARLSGSGVAREIEAALKEKNNG